MLITVLNLESRLNLAARRTTTTESSSFWDGTCRKLSPGMRRSLERRKRGAVGGWNKAQEAEDERER
jgi:hypothetical protein